MLNDKQNKIKGLMSNLEEQAEEAELEEQYKVSTDMDLDSINLSSVISPVEKVRLVSKAFTLRADQAKELSVHSKRAKKNDSEFMRDVLDLMFEMIRGKQGK